MGLFSRKKDKSTVNIPTGDLQALQEKVLASTTELDELKKTITSATNQSIINEYQVSAALGNTFTKVSTLKKDIIRVADEVSNNYLVDAILTQFVEDALTPSIEDSDVLTVEANSGNDAKDKKLNKHIEFLDGKFKFDQLALDIAFDVCRYGEFILKTEIVDGKGLVDLFDTVDQSEIVPITKNGEIQYYIVKESKWFGSKKAVKEPSEFVRFVLGKFRIRLDLFKEYNIRSNSKAVKFLKTFPRYIRIGKSVLYSVLPKIKELELLEALVPATKLAKLASGTIVSMELPANMDPKEMLATCKILEGAINKKVGIDTTNKEMTIAKVLSQAGNIKVIPNSGGKGGLNKLDYKSDEPDDLLASVKDLRDVICTSMGYPPELLFANDEGKGTTLKRYARYLRILRGIQRAIADGIRQLIAIHVVNVGDVDIVPEKEIKVEFRNKLLNIDNTESLEFLDTSVGMMSNTIDFIDKLIMVFGEEAIDIEPMAQFVNSNLGIAGITDVVNPKKIKKPELAEEPEVEKPAEETPAEEEPEEEPVTKEVEKEPEVPKEEPEKEVEEK
jgi:hypothetical protein